MHKAVWRNDKRIALYFVLEYLEKIVMTGISVIVRASSFSGLNNVSEYKFLVQSEFNL